MVPMNDLTELANRPSRRSGNNRTNKIIKCTNCGRNGHTRIRYWGKEYSDHHAAMLHTIVLDKYEQIPFRATDQNDRQVEHAVFACLLSKINKPSSATWSLSWIMDSGCTTDITFDRKLFVSYQSTPEIPIEMGTAENAFAVGKGSIHLEVKHNNEFVTIERPNVLYIPSLKYSLISVSVLDKKELFTEFQNG